MKPMGVPDKEPLEDRAFSGRPDLSLASKDRQSTSDTLTAAVEGRCVNCNAPLAPDQRYCVHCGQRRGRSRFALAGGAAEARQASAAPIRSEPPRRRGSSSGTTVVAGIATLVLALGVGVEIGRLSNNNNPTPVASAQKPQVNIYNGGAGSSAAQSGTTAASSSAAAGSSSKHSGSHAKHSKPSATAQTSSTAKPTSQAVQKASSAASGVLGGSGGQSNATVTTGQSCAAGTAGCQNGHFSGGFFGGG